MEPITLSTAFATIVSLVADFNSSRTGTAAASVEHFKSWLTENRHQDVVDALERNAATLISVKTLLFEDRMSLSEQLRTLDEQLARIASGLQLFRPLSRAIHPGVELSDQAIDLLEQLDASSASKFLKSHSLSGTRLLMIDGTGASGIKLNEPRFLESDLDTLLQLRLIKHIATNSNRDPVYAFTRAAADLVKARRPSA